MNNPYRGLPENCFWSSSMTAPAPGRIDPVTRSERIGAGERVATLGSCFAQHLSDFIRRSGLNYYDAEPAPPQFDPAEARRRGYGVFSARYGNVYTVRQAVQLFDRAFGQFQPVESVWEKNGRFFDAFRPLVEPRGHASASEVRAAATEHFECVRELFRKAKWLVFTLGQTEAWRHVEDGAVYPLAPGVAAGSYDPGRHEHVNFTAGEVSADLAAFLEKLRAVNNGLRVILTVSPVPLIATYERRHVLVSATFSKAALRVAADVAERKCENVIYFPSYEIITSPASGGRYYRDDLRQVTDLGVRHVMRLFETHFFERPAPHLVVAPEADPLPPPGVHPGEEVVCDEETIEESLKAVRLGT